MCLNMPSLLTDRSWVKSEVRNSRFCFTHNSANIALGTAKFGGYTGDSTLYFCVKNRDINAQSVEKTGVEVRQFCQTGSSDGHW